MTKHHNQAIHWANPRSGKHLVYAGVLGGLMLLASCTPPPQTATSPNPTGVSTNGSPSPTLTIPTSPTPTPSPTSTAEKPASVKAVETKLADLVTKATGLTVQAVDCPADLVEKAGTTYNCTITSEVGIFTGVVEPTDQPGQFNWGTKGLLLLTKLNSFIQQSVQNQGGGPVTVDCGGKAKIAKVGETFECKVTDAKGGTRTTRVTVRDEVGNVFIAPQ
ncbi:MAG: DUF4333 domain-containing protein [Leptodesmis sp.]|uniref:DUF4333 domain-containing protein n=1 Tax=Leptodesmis sp. TaxID=3100501 RepID=UPI003D12119A